MVKKLTGDLNRLSLAFGLIVTALSLVWPQQSHAATVVLTLTRMSTLTNVDDGEGRWQFDGGQCLLNGQPVGFYERRKRVSFGVNLNTAAVTITLFATGDDPPENITLQGSHSFNTGAEIGSVSAASSAFSAVVGGTFSVTSSDILTINF